jgi:hypothetical protein
MEKGKVWLNGELIPWENATVHIMSHGFSRGSTIIEVFGVHPLAGGPAVFRLDCYGRVRSFVLTFCSGHDTFAI